MRMNDSELELEAKLEDLQRQCDKLFKLHGLPSWREQERQRLDNAKSQGSKLPFHPGQAHGDLLAEAS